MHIVRSIIDLPYSHCPSASVHYHLSIPRGRRFFFSLGNTKPYRWEYNKDRKREWREAIVKKGRKKREPGSSLCWQQRAEEGAILYSFWCDFEGSKRGASGEVRLDWHKKDRILDPMKHVMELIMMTFNPPVSFYFKIPMKSSENAYWRLFSSVLWSKRLKSIYIIYIFTWSVILRYEASGRHPSFVSSQSTLNRSLVL